MYMNVTTIKLSTTKKVGVSVVLAFLLLMSVNITHAQNAIITGTVIDSTTSEPLPSVNVGFQDLGVGAATNVDGEFEIDNVPPGTHTLTASFIGFDAKEIPIEVSAGETLEININLVPATYVGDEVVVTALGIERSEKSVGFGVQEVSGEQISESPDIGVVNSLAGKTAGLQITGSSGQPGSASRIVIRGANSITGNNQPLFVVDGVPISNADNGSPGGSSALYAGGGSNRALDIDPSIIENITVLKGGSATALYGSRASKGVVQITTKNGQQGDIQVDFNSKIRFDDAIIEGTQDEYLSGEQGYFANGLSASRGGYMEPGYPGSNPETANSWGPHQDNVSQQVLNDLGVNSIKTYNHLEEFYQVGTSAENSLTFSGGDENGTFFLSASRLDQIGTVPTTSLNRTNLNAKVRRDLFKDKLESETRVNYVKTNNEWQRNGYTSSARITRIWPINLQMKPYQYEDGTNRTLGDGTDSPYWQTNETGFDSSIDRLMLTQGLTYNITPWLELTERFGLDSYTDSRSEQRNRRQRLANDGSMYEQKIVDSEINNDVILDLQEVQIVEGFSVSALLGNNINIRNYSDVDVSATGQNIPGFYDESNFNDIDGGKNESHRRLVSVYSEVVFDYEDYLFLTLTGRNDWSSTLPEDNQSYFYPSASLGFVFSELFNITENTPMSFGKLRASVSQTGSDAPVYSLSTEYNSAGFSQFITSVDYGLDFPYNGVSGFMQSGTLGNPNLKPEMTTTYEVGTNLRFFSGRATFDIAYYSETTKDQIYSTPVSSGTGFTNMLRNAGEIRNEGVELTVTGAPIETQNFQWNLTANWSKNKNKVVSLAPGVQRIFLAGFSWPSVQAQEDLGYGIIRGYAYQRNDEGQLIINDNANSPAYGHPIQAQEQKTIGNIQPDWLGNLRSTLQYKGFSISGLLDVRKGGDIMNFGLNYTITNGMAEMTENRGTQMQNSDQPGYIEPYTFEGVKESNGETNDIQLVRNQDFWERYGAVHENQVEDGSFIKLREVSLGYHLSSNILSQTPLRTASLKVTGRNLWIDTDFSYGDPEGNLYGSQNGGQGYYMFITPPSRSVMFNLQIGI